MIVNLNLLMPVPTSLSIAHVVSTQMVVCLGIMDYFRYRHVNDTGGYCGPGTNQR